MYINTPSQALWERKNYVNAQTMTDDFVYTSHQNSVLMIVEQFRQIVFGLDFPKSKPVRQLAHAN